MQTESAIYFAGLRGEGQGGLAGCVPCSDAVAMVAVNSIARMVIVTSAGSQRLC